MVNLNSLGMAIVHLAFFTLFPGFFFYQSALGAGITGAFLGGYFSPVSLMFLPVLLLLYLLGIKKNKRFFTRMDFAFVTFLMYFSFTVALHFATGENQDVVRD